MIHEKVYAPFTPEQIEKIKKWQADPKMPTFTCPNDKNCGHEDRVLKAGKKQLTCPCGEFGQYWVYAEMLK